MTSIQEQIQQASSKNSQLLAGLHETESAPSQLYHQVTYIQDLDAQLKECEERVADLKKQTASELEDHKKYSESTFRRFAHKASGRKERFVEKAAKEEQEYFDAIQAQKTAEDDLADIRQLRAGAEATRVEYEANAQRHDYLQHELDALYESIFAGHKPGFPDEEKEHNVNIASQNCAELIQILDKERQLGHLFKQINEKLNKGRIRLNTAHTISQYDMGMGGSMAIQAEPEMRKYVGEGESAISEATTLQDQVNQIDSSRDEIGPMDLASGAISRNIVINSLYNADMVMHNKIKKRQTQIHAAIEKIEQQIKASEENEIKVNIDLQQGNEMLKQARMNLQKAREHVFERVQAGDQIDLKVVGKVPTDQPPAYWS